MDCRTPRPPRPHLCAGIQSGWTPALNAVDSRDAIRVWDLSSRKQLLKLETGGKIVTGLAFGLDNCLLGSRDDGRIQVWLAPSRPPLVRLEGHRFPVGECKVSRNSNFVASSNRAQKDIPTEVKLWDALNDKLLFDLSGMGGGGVRSLSFSPDSTLLAAGNKNIQTGLTEVVVWDVRSGAVRLRLAGPDFDAFLGFSEDSKRVICAAFPKKTWDVDTGQFVPAKPGDEIDATRRTGEDRRYVPIPMGTTILLVPSERTTPLEIQLIQQWNQSTPELHGQLSKVDQRAGQHYSAWFHAEQMLAVISGYSPDAYRYYDEQLLAASSRFPNHVVIQRAAARRAVVNPKDAGDLSVFLRAASDEAIAGFDLGIIEVVGWFAASPRQAGRAIAPLKMAVELRPNDAVPIEDLLLALAYRAKNLPAESRRWIDRASEWTNRERNFRQAFVTVCGGGVSCLPALNNSTRDSRYRPADWEAWRELYTLWQEVQGKK